MCIVCNICLQSRATIFNNFIPRIDLSGFLWLFLQTADTQVQFPLTRAGGAYRAHGREVEQMSPGGRGGGAREPQEWGSGARPRGLRGAASALGAVSLSTSLNWV